MATEWGFIKRLGSNRGASLDSSILSGANEFELPADIQTDFSGRPSRSPSPGFSLASMASSIQSFSPSGSIKRLGSSGRADAAPIRSSVLFDADEMTSSAAVEPPPFDAPARTPAPLPARNSWENGAGSGVAPSKSALTFLQRVEQLGSVQAAIGQEIKARQASRLKDFSDVWKAQGMEAAVAGAVNVITDGGRNGLQRNEKVINSLKRFNNVGSSLDQAHKARFNIEQLQNYHHGGSKGTGLSSAEIAANFQKNGAGLPAAEVALAFIESSHDYIQATEINSTDRIVRQEAAKSAPAAQGQRPGAVYDDHTRGGGSER